MYQQQQNNESNVDLCKSLAASLPSKTPVSLLQELCMRRGISPKYDLLQIEGAVHEPTFVYRVTVGEFSANGSGQSKKKAKHAAAKAVLDIIIHGNGPAPTSAPTTHNNGENPSTTTTTTGNAELAAMVVSPYDDGIPGNPVGQLQELCMSRRWPPPTYELTSEEGFPHERTFTIACTIATYKEVGRGKSKKLAKRQAAYSMLQKLSDLPQEQQPASGLNEDEDDLQKLSIRYAGLKDSKVSLPVGDARKSNQFHKVLKNKAGPHLKDIQKINLSANNLNFLQLLQEISEENNFMTTFVDVEEKSLKGDYQCLLQLGTAPVAVCFGSGSTADDARAAAAHNALEYLKVMTKR